MAYLIGTDEAGYGPNLGPLLVSATVWKVPDRTCDLHDELRNVVSKTPPPASKQSRPSITIADSKLLYKPKGGLGGLELPLFATLPVGGQSNPPRTWRDCWRVLTADHCEEIDRLLWYRDFDCPLPIDSDPEKTTDARECFLRETRSRSIELQTVRSVAVFPSRFNQLVNEYDSKGTALSNVTLDLVANLIQELPDEPIDVVCDKHGGRNSYAGFLQPRFSDRLVRVHRESRAESSYEVGTADQPITISFRSKGESFLPSALASIASKYLRELAMKAFNDFWTREVPNLKSTAGYPQDAKRFRLDVESHRRKLNITEDVFWRGR
ncbi:MAG: hypothetical protein KDB27_33355 [Planctomycetales bacterium]|nr:hypothetical protein [Planctomycetales bacterium]